MSHPPLSDAARVYTDAEFDALVASLPNLTLNPRTPPPTPSNPPRSPTPPPDYTPPATPRSAQRPRYQFQSPTATGLTAAWSEASFHTQGTSNGRVTALSKQRKRRGRRKSHAVFYGRLPGVYKEWEGEHGAEIQVTRVRGALHQGYESPEEAEAAFHYAQQHSWTGERDSRSPSPSSSARLSIPALPLPLTSEDDNHAPNPLQGTKAPHWHIVYAGITPGVYASFLECALNTIGLSGASYDSTDSFEEAQRLWLDAVTAGEVRVITPKYRTHA
ncbi:hypothetical protein DFH06DRAFT_1347780 [Mycena polygramma]|nr:hypothetical protein DFH06DRAFT_1351212 [Mycena polygramma]KAJ7607006.1 hypothetical protein DFH06DRAFT_1347780 [Mycena polygramma]